MTSQRERQIEVGWMCRRHLASVQAIERASFEFPWDETDFIAHLQQRNAIALVARREPQVVGFVTVELRRRYVELTNLAVDPIYRRQGIGELLVARAKGLLCGRRQSVVAIVRESNLAAQLFFRDTGFRCVDILRDWWNEPCAEDAYRMRFEPAGRGAGQANAAEVAY